MNQSHRSSLVSQVDLLSEDVDGLRAVSVASDVLAEEADKIRDALWHLEEAIGKLREALGEENP